MKYTVNFDGQDIAFSAQEKDSEAIKRIITDLLTHEGFVNLYIDDVKAIVDGEENIAASVGTASGENRCSDAANEAVKNIKGAKKLLVSVTSGPEITLAEMIPAAMAVQEAYDSDAELIWGHVIDEAMGDAVKVSVVAAI